jgi:hypothetical protein
MTDDYQQLLDMDERKLPVKALITCQFCKAKMNHWQSLSNVNFTLLKVLFIKRAAELQASIAGSGSQLFLNT